MKSWIKIDWLLLNPCNIIIAIIKPKYSFQNLQFCQLNAVSQNIMNTVSPKENEYSVKEFE